MALAAAGSGVRASEAELGRVEAMLDGALRHWVTLADGPDGGAGSTGITAFERLFAVSLRGYPSGRGIADRSGDRLGVLVIGFAVARDGGAVGDARVRYHAEDFAGAYVTAPGTEGLVTLTRFDARAGTVVGLFEGRMCWRPDPIATPDPARCRDIAGSFDTALPRSR